MTLGAMQAITDDAVWHSPLAERTASAIAASQPQRDFVGQVRALYKFVRDRVRFRRDTFPAEHLRQPDHLLDQIAQHGTTSADCDDGTMLTATLLRCLGFPAYFVVVGRRADGRLEHVFPALRFAGEIIGLDPQERRPPGPLTPFPRTIIVPAQEQTP